MTFHSENKCWIFFIFASFSVNPRFGCVGKSKKHHQFFKYSPEPVWHQQLTHSLFFLILKQGLNFCTFSLKSVNFIEPLTWLSVFLYCYWWLPSNIKKICWHSTCIVFLLSTAYKALLIWCYELWVINFSICCGQQLKQLWDIWRI